MRGYNHTGKPYQNNGAPYFWMILPEHDLRGQPTGRSQMFRSPDELHQYRLLMEMMQPVTSQQQNGKERR